MGILSNFFKRPKYRILTTVDGKIIPQFKEFQHRWSGIASDMHLWIAIENQHRHCVYATLDGAKVIIELHRNMKTPTETYEYIY